MFSSLRAVSSLVARRSIATSSSSLTRASALKPSFRLSSSYSAAASALAAPSHSPLPSGPAPPVRPLDDVRRARFRSQWLKKFTEDELADQDFISVCDSIGDDSNLNWSVVDDRVVVNEFAYRNANDRIILEMSDAKHVNRALRYSINVDVSAEAAQPTQFIVGENITAAQKRVIQRETRRHLSSLLNLFVNDGELGADTSSTVAIRAYSDNAIHSKLLRGIIQPIPQHNPTEYQRAFVIYVVEELPSSVYEESSVSETPFVLIDDSTKELFVVGSFSTAVLRDAIFKAVQRFVPSPEGTQRVRASLFSLQGEKPVALFHEGVLPQYLPLEAEQGVVLSEDRCSRVFNTRTQVVSDEKTVQRSQVLEKFPKHSITQMPLQSSGNILSPVFAGAVLSSKATKKEKLSLDQMKQHRVDEAWIEYAKAHKLDTFAVPLGSGKDLVTVLSTL
eukprot:CAMPEP_0177657788 /NCGR_PEP_ID=MMETSP0447-20121125/16411_1 /TAXON_ID=0 /ORGANISM="Stygamoeba regulata, Strain BSH-02190019" /LENGTH=447 /DNA_ID=CAMNT_0019162245 /DNA_START=69 /DNA_END=1412 /DNA_ORIENTATION=-